MSAISTTAEFEENRHLMDLYSRQIGAFGVEAMVKLVQMKVLFVGVTGVGVEAAKNTTLAGAHTVALYDNNEIQMRDLGANFFLTEADIGSNRASTVVPRLAQLNPLVRVKVQDGELNEAVLRSYDVVVVTDKTVPKETLCQWDEICRTRTKTVYSSKGDPTTVPNPTSFLYCFNGGVFSSLFVDHGDLFTIRDHDGKDPLVKIIQSMERHVEMVKDDSGKEVENHYTLIRFITPEGQPPGSLPENCLVEISDVEGMVALSPETVSNYGPTVSFCGPWRTSTKSSDPVNTVRIGDTRGFSMYVSGGFLTEVKEPRNISFLSYAQACVESSNTETAVYESGSWNYGFVATDFMSLFTQGGVEVQVHFALQGVQAFLEEHGHLPEINNKDHAAEVVANAKKINDTLVHFQELVKGSAPRITVVPELDEALITKFSLWCGTELQPLATSLGGIVAQELVKISGRFTPIRQFLNLNALKSLPDELPADTAPLNSRYDDQIAVFGKAFQEKLGNLKLFMVGCGALGCEYLKNFAMMGICCGKDGLLEVTDNDTVEISNLSRQFLFREDNVGHSKSEAASKRVVGMNPAFNVHARQDLVAVDTEHVFHDKFWTGLDLVCNALDNMKARAYVDGKCVLYEKPLLESGTMGTGFNVDVIIPKVTGSYSDGGDAEEGGGIPMCTLRNFPHLIDHCIEWARARFTDIFVTPPAQLQQFLENPAEFLSTLEAKIDEHTGGERVAALERGIETLEELTELSKQVTEKVTIEKCVEFAWNLMHSFFRDAILDLVATFPADATTKSGNPFWSGHKIFPKELMFDPTNDLHLEFLISTANLYACVFKLHPEKYPAKMNASQPQRWMAEFRDKEWVRGVLAQLDTPEYVRHKVQDLDDDSKADAQGDSSGDAEDEDAIEEQFETLKNTLYTIGTSLKNVSVAPLDFEKDDDDNFHIDFIYSASNLRGTNYSIPVASRHKCKMIAGRIIPAVATSTACVTGMVMLELYKLIQGKPIEAYQQANFDLGTNTYFAFEPSPARKLRDSVQKVFDQASYDEDLKAYQRQVDQQETKINDLKRAKMIVDTHLPSAVCVDPLTKEIEKTEAMLSAVIDQNPDLDEYYEDIKTTYYPKEHTKWDKIVLPSSVNSVADAVAHLKSEHKLNVSGWFVEGKKVFPPEVQVDYSLLPAIDTSMNDGIRHLMKVGGAHKNALITAWRAAKASGKLPEVKETSSGSDADLSFADLCAKFEVKLENRTLLAFSDVDVSSEDGDELTIPPIVYFLE